MQHLPLFLLSAASICLLYETRPYTDRISRFSFATAYPAIALIAVTLALGPLNVLRKRRNPISGDLRRDVGIWAGILSLVHAVVGQTVHLRGRPWLYYVYESKAHHAIPLRHDLFGFSNYTGAFSAVLVLALLATSNDISLRALGTPRWKALQRWNYAAFALAIFHTAGYQSTAKHNTGFEIFVGLATCMALLLQYLGYRQQKLQAATVGSRLSATT